MVKKIFVILFNILFLTIGLTILQKPEKENNSMVETCVINEKPTILKNLNFDGVLTKDMYKMLFKFSLTVCC